MPPIPDADRAADQTVLVARRWFDGYRLNESPIAVHVAGGRVISLDRAPEITDGTELDPDSILCPGFIDTHSHSDFSIPADPRAVGAVVQGITTQVTGQCGFSAAPLDPSGPSGRAIADDPTAIPGSEQPAWRSFGDYIEHLDDLRPAINVVPLVGHNTLIRFLDDASPDLVAGLADSALAEGARGVSTGLSYQLGRRSTAEGVARLAEVAARHESLYHTHMRYSEEETVDTLGATLELLAGRHARPTISHVFPRLRDQRTTPGALLEVIDRYASEFDALTFDITVYESGGTAWTQGLPGWAIGSDYSALADLASDRDWRERVARYLIEEASGWVVDWPNLVVTKVNRLENRGVLGVAIGELAEAAGVRPETYAIDLLISDGHFWVSPPNKRWTDILEMLSHARCIPMGDGMTVDPSDPTGVVALERSWNAFRRFLSRAVGPGALSLETALRKLTSDAARRLGLVGRGVVEVGAAADFTVVNPSVLSDLSGPDFDVTGRGIDGVMVNGTWVLDLRQKLTDRRPGNVL